MKPAAIRAAFAEWRMVKSRKVLQLVFELPLEQQAEVLTTLGAPMPDVETWCGIARLTDVPEARPVSQRAERGKQEYSAKTEMEKAVVRAALLPKDERFREWVCRNIGVPMVLPVAAELAIDFIRDECCDGESRRRIGEDADCYLRFIKMETQFKADTGMLAEPR